MQPFVKPLLAFAALSFALSGAHALEPVTTIGGAGAKVHDAGIHSPKSVTFAGDRAFVHSLEGGRTVVYRTGDQARVGEVVYVSSSTQAAKPVESVLTHDGKYLWVTHYRKSADLGGRQNSTVSIIDTASLRVVRTIDSGPVPKMIAWSPATQQVAISNWGDNTVHLWNAKGNEPAQWSFEKEIVIGGQKYTPPAVVTNRDRQCGYCLRGTAFSPEGDWLLVARMGGGGIVAVKLAEGTQKVWNGAPQPTRHMIMGPDGVLYLSSTSGTAVSRVAWTVLRDALQQGRLDALRSENLHLPGAVRTIALAPRTQRLYATNNTTSTIVEIDLPTWRVKSSVPTARFPVGLGVTPDERQVWVTAQGKQGVGGNMVSVYAIAP